LIDDGYLYNFHEQPSLKPSRFQVYQTPTTVFVYASTVKQK
jgi:hypothetical protein